MAISTHSNAKALKVFFLFFCLFLHVLRLYVTFWLMTDLKGLYIHNSASILPILFFISTLSHELELQQLLGHLLLNLPK